MKHFQRSLLAMMLCSASISMIHAESHEAQELLEETLVQCASCSCMVAKDAVTRGVALCQCCSTQDEATRLTGCQCEQAAVAEQCQVTRGCCDAQKSVIADVESADEVATDDACSKKKANE